MYKNVSLSRWEVKRVYSAAYLRYFWYVGVDDCYVFMKSLWTQSEGDNFKFSLRVYHTSSNTTHIGLIEPLVHKHIHTLTHPEFEEPIINVSLCILF